MKKNFRNTVVVTCMVTIIFVSYFIYRWYSVKESESYQLAVVTIKKEYPSIQEENIDLILYKRSWPSQGAITEYVNFKFELNEKETYGIEMKKESGEWIIISAPKLGL